MVACAQAIGVRTSERIVRALELAFLAAGLRAVPRQAPVAPSAAFLAGPGIKIVECAEVRPRIGAEGFHLRSVGVEFGAAVGALHCAISTA